MLGEAAGPGTAVALLVAGSAGVLVAGLVPSPTLRVVLAVVAFALLGTAVMQRALDGLARSPLAVAIDERASGRIVATLVDDPDAARFDASALVRVQRRRVLVTASGDVAGHLRLLSAGESAVLRGWFAPLEGFDERWRWKHAVGAFHATDLVGVGPAHAPLDQIANQARALVLAGSEHLAPTDACAPRRLPPRRHARRARRAHRAVPRRRPHAPHRRVGGERRVRVGVGCAAAAAARAARPGGRGVGGVGVLRHDDPVGAVGAAGDHDGGGGAGGRVPGASDRRPQGARVGGDGAAARGPVPPPPGGVPPVVRGEPGHHGAGPTDHRPVARSRRGCATCSGSPWPRRSASLPSSSPCSVRCHWSRSRPISSRCRWLHRSRCGGSPPGCSGASTRPVSPAIPRVLELPTVGLLHALIAVADVASRVPFAVDGRAAWGLLALGALLTAADRARRRRRHERSDREPGTPARNGAGAERPGT